MLKALKILTSVMGVMIVVGFAILVVGLIDRMTAKNGDARETTDVADPGEPYELSIDVPDGARIGAMRTTQTHVIVPMTLTDGDRRLTVIDPASGAVAGTVTVRPQGGDAEAREDDGEGNGTVDPPASQDRQ